MSALTCKIKCLVCQKEFKTNRGFSRHNNTIRKLNKLSLSKNSKNTSFQAVSLTCPEVSLTCSESIFQVNFEDYIHCYNKQTGVFRCIFCGSTRYQELSNILNDVNWGVKYHSQSQKTYVQLTPHDISQDQHPLIRCAKEEAAITTVKNSKKQARKLKYPCGVVIIEWREKKDIDSKKNICQAGFIYIHFFTAKKYF
ncbi:hypothetical protein F8M41_013079 [Gigaspora margarita]|uniref:C2H2-type domain-containing protein n=1 Tax=Gigaspora margarita TaxID=4874 RepID=A0A8H3WYS7_GIGMA|nr:hypothetical protein F8M41_013079 [Gigaspora margarita]